jgi:hypothetical protein
MKIDRRDAFKLAAMAGSAALGQVDRKAATAKPGMPGAYPGPRCRGRKLDGCSGEGDRIA